MGNRITFKSSAHHCREIWEMTNKKGDPKAAFLFIYNQPSYQYV